MFAAPHEKAIPEMSKHPAFLALMENLNIEQLQVLS
jgi:hypothetical protein